MKISTDVAEKDYQRFVDALKLNPLKLKSLETPKKDGERSEKEVLIEMIELGMVVINNDDIPVFKIFEPQMYGDQEVSELVFRKDKPKVSDMEKNSVGKNDIEKTRRTFAFLVDGKYPSSFFSRLESDDLTNFSNVASFFLPH